MRQKTMIAFAVLALLLVGGPVAAGHQFPDVPDGADGTWAANRHDAVDRLASDGIVTGFPDGTFRGSTSANRNQFALWMNRAYDAWIAPLQDRISAVECSPDFERQVVDVYVQADIDGDPEFETGWMLVETCALGESFVESPDGAPLPPESPRR